MKNLLYIALTIVVNFNIAACSKIDNYPAPSETLKGKVIDINTGKTVQTEIGDAGTRIKLLETSWSDSPTPFYIYSRQDGTFSNNKLFKGTHNVSAEGPFVPLVYASASDELVDNSKVIQIGAGTTTVDFNVEPFLEINWVGEPVFTPDSSVTVQVEITRGTSNPSFQQNITDVYLFVNNTQYIGNNNFDSRYATQVNFTGNAADSILGKVLTITTSGGPLPSKRSLFVRVGARTDYGLKMYNYNEPKEIKIP